MTKKIFLFLDIIILIALLTACVIETGKQQKNSEENSMFTTIETTKGLTYEIVYNKKTKVIYSVSNNGIMTVLLNPDGTPMLYEE